MEKVRQKVQAEPVRQAEEKAREQGIELPHRISLLPDTDVKQKPARNAE